MFQRESKANIEQYCSSAGFEIISSYEPSCIDLVFENVASLLQWHWSTTHGVFDLSLVTEERLQRYLAPYVNKEEKPCLDFQGMKEEAPACRLTAVKQTRN